MNESRYMSLVMTFETEEGSKSTVTMKQIRDDLEKRDLQPLMEAIITTGIFNTKDVTLSKAIKAEIIDRVTEAYDLRPKA